MSTNQSQHPSFYEDQYLGADDLNAGIDFSRILTARHDLGAHTWGIAAGLQITVKDSPSGGGQVDAYIQPGYAWDGFGRPIIVLSPYQIPAELFKSYVYDSSLDGGTPPPPGRLIKVWLIYNEAATNAPTAGFETCATGSQFSRIQESFRLEIGEMGVSAQRDLLTVAGLSLDAAAVLQQFNPQTPPVVLGDGSVAYQDFPLDNPAARWLVPLGNVRWLPNPDATQPGNFVKVTDPTQVNADNTSSFYLRTYAGVVAGTVYAADGVIRMRDRTVDYTKQPVAQVQSNDLVWVEGDLRLEGDTHLFGGKLDFRDNNGLQNKAPLLLQRQQASASNVVLQAVIGQQDPTQSAAFSVGPLDTSSPPKFQAKFTVLDNGNTGIGTTTPDQLLTVSGSGDTYLSVIANSGANEVLLGADAKGAVLAAVSNEDLQFKSGDNINMIIKADGQVGIGSSDPNQLLTLYGAAGTYLNVKADNGVHEVLLGADANGGILSTMTNHDLQFRSGGNVTQMIVKANGQVGIGTTNPQFLLDIQGDFGRNNGPAIAHLWGSSIGDTGYNRLFIRASTGGSVVFDGGNNVGIGTINPQYLLDIQGDFGRSNGRVTVHLWGSRIGDLGDGVLFFRSGGSVVAFDESDDKVGIGLNKPIAKLHVQDSIDKDPNSPDAHVTVIENTNTGNQANVLALKAAVPAMLLGSKTDFITFFWGDTAIGNINGTFDGLSNIVTYSSGGADFAECLPRIRDDETLKAGDVVGIFTGGGISKTTAGAHHVAVITDRPVVVGNQQPKDREAQFAQVALLGQVGVRVRGPVQSGDFIIPSGLHDGVGRAVSPALLNTLASTQIIGQAWESSDLQAEKIINVAVGLSSNNANLALASQVNAQQREITALRAELKNLMALITGSNPDEDKS